MEPDMMDTETPNYFSFLGRQAPKKKRKRGGLAGLWDRNKGAIGSIAGAALGNMLVPGAGAAAGKLLGGAAGGALARGRFDAGRAVGDAFMGSAGVGAGKVLGAGIGGARAAAGSGNLGAMVRDFGTAAKGEAARQFGSAPQGFDETLRQGGGASTVTGKGAMAAQPRGLNRVLQFIEKNSQAAGMGAQALSGILGAQEQRRIEEARLKEERRRAENFARAAMPLYLESFRGR